MEEQQSQSVSNIENMDLTTANPARSKLKEHWLNFERNELIILISYFLFGIAFSNYEPYAPLWLNEFFSQNSFLIIGFVVIIPSLVGIIASPFWGYFADKFGSKIFVIVGLIAYTLMFFSLIFTVSSFYFLSMILVGYFFGSAMTNNIFVLATKTSSKPKEVILAKFSMTVSLAYAIFSPVVGWIYDTFPNSMMIQLCIALGASTVAVILVFFTKDNVAIEKDEKKLEVGDEKKKEVITSVPLAFIGVLLVTFFFQMGAGFWAYSSIYFLKTPEVSLFTSPNKGVIFSVFIIIKTVLAVPLSFLFGRIKKRKHMGLIITVFTAYFVLIFTLQTIFPTNWILLLILYGLPMYPVYNVFFYCLASHYSNENRRGTAFGILSAIGTIGYVSGILIIGAFADYVQIGTYAGIFVSFPISLIISILAFLTALGLYLVKLRKEIEVDFCNNLEVEQIKPLEN